MSKTPMRDPHLQLVRGVHAQRVRGASHAQIARSRDITIYRVQRLLAEYETLRKAGTLFQDIDTVTEADQYEHASIMQRMAMKRDAAETKNDA